MSAHDAGTEGSSSMSRPSSVDPNINVLSETIRSSMENSMELLSATKQRDALVMASTIRDGFVARPFIEGSCNTLSKKWAGTSSQVALNDSSGSSHIRSQNMAREDCTAQVVVAYVGSFLDPFALFLTFFFHSKIFEFSNLFEFSRI